MKLYVDPVSVTSRPVLLFIAESGISCEIQVVDLTAGDHLKESYAKVNPSRLVPVLDDDGFMLSESSAILKYLADKIESPLYPKNLQQRARVNERMDWFNTQFYREFGYHLVYPQVLPHHVRPSAQVQDGTLVWGKERAASVMQVLNDHLLGDHRYVCGDALSLADLFGSSMVLAGQLIRADISKYGNVTRWLDTLSDLANWNKVTEAHRGWVAALEGKTFVGL
jgi:glutathione S-transferase